ncbi:MAG: nucleoside triphosphate hydrolase [Colwellia sp. Phe_37]|nr:MAG: nucleoside triphosphate hydrolase [Colwellia sp. Phe_37]
MANSLSTQDKKLSKNISITFELSPADNNRLANLCGAIDDNLKTIERRMGVEISYRSHEFKVTGKSLHCEAVKKLLIDLYLETETIKGKSSAISAEMVHLAIVDAGVLEVAPSKFDAKYDEMVTIKTKRGMIKPRNENQQNYVQNVITNDISFGVGVAGTGKTYLAVACAVDALERQEIRRILLTRPAVEAGEKLGFLPGDLSQKVDPYLRPLYDALFEMLGFEKVEKLIERNVIEVAPLAYMRGRTLNDAFIILDESQNTTVEQMKMFLTRIGFNSRAVITGDITQVDLPRGQKSGLRHAIEVLVDIPGVSFNFFQSKDVVRHPVVAHIVEAYEAFEQKENILKKEKQQKREQQQKEQAQVLIQASENKNDQ